MARYLTGYEAISEFETEGKGRLLHTETGEELTLEEAEEIADHDPSWVELELPDDEA